ncbi:hypothetical protein ACTXT7_008971, partial [Hymenolepis weldensis]
MSLPFGGDDVSEVVDMLRKIRVCVQAANEQLGHSDSKDIADLLKTSKLIQGPLLRSHQLEGIRWILDLYKNGLNGILADEMGLGKTAQIIASMALMAENGSPGPFLVVVPLSLLYSWSEQMNTFAPDFPHILYYGSATERVALRKQIKVLRMHQKSAKVHQTQWKSGFLSTISLRLSLEYKSESTTLGNLEETLEEVISRKRFCPLKELSIIRKNLDTYSPEYQQAICSLPTPESQRDVKKKFAKSKKPKISTTPGVYKSNPEYLANLDKVIDDALASNDEFTLPVRFDSPFNSEFNENNTGSSTTSDFTDDRSASRDGSRPYFSTAYKENELQVMVNFDQNTNNILYRDCGAVSCKLNCENQPNTEQEVYLEVSTRNLSNHSGDLSIVITEVVNVENNVKMEYSANLMQSLHSEIYRGIESESIQQVSMLSMQASPTADDLFYSAPSSPIDIFQDVEKIGDKKFHTNESTNNLISSTVHEDISGLDPLSPTENGYNAEVNVQENNVNDLTDNTGVISQEISMDSLNPMLSLDSNKSSDAPIEMSQNEEIEKIISQVVSAEDISQDQCQISMENKNYGPEISANSGKKICPSEFHSGTEGFSTLPNNPSSVNSNEPINNKGETKFISTDNLSNDNQDILTKTEEIEIELENEISPTTEDKMGVSEIQDLRREILPVIITTYEIAIKDCSFLNQISFKAMIVDEAQRIKRAASKLYQCLQTYDAEVRLVVTGTSLQNSISELWILLHFLLPEIFPMVADFADTERIQAFPSRLTWEYNEAA